MSDQLKFEVLLYGIAGLAAIAGLWADADLRALVLSITGMG